MYRQLLLVLLLACAISPPEATVNTWPESERQATRDALARMANDGVDLKQSHQVDFQVAVATKGGAEKIAQEARERGFATELVQEERGDWTVWCTRTLVPTEPHISTTEQLLQSLAQPHGGRIDGWGVLSNP